jgi:uncharacterized protein
MVKNSKYVIKVQYKDGLLMYSPISNFIIPIEKEDVESLNVHLYNLDAFKKNEPQIFELFKKHSFIVQSDFNEVDYIKFQNKLSIFYDRCYRLTINPTLECNMNCWYCTVDAAANFRPNKRMSDSTMKNLIDHISSQINSRSIDELFLDWFGGEPLLYFREVIYPISKIAQKLSKAQRIPLKQFITTNGYLIEDSMIDEFNEIKLNNFQITLDGNRAKHNTIRKHYGADTFDKILDNIVMICCRVENPTIQLRINYDKKTLNGLYEIIEKLNEPDVREKIVINFQKVFQVDRSKTQENGALKKAIHLFENYGFRTRYWAYRPQAFHTCYSDRYYHRVINYDGNVFKCTARKYNIENRIGVLKKGGEIELDTSIMSIMFSDSTFNNDICLDCNLLPLCFGPCIQKNYEVKRNTSRFECLLRDAEFSVDSFVIDEAKKRKII